MTLKNKMRYILIRHETITKTEEVQYEIDIPVNIRSKKEYAEEQITEGNYSDSKVVNVLDSQMVDENNLSFRKKLNMLS